MIHHTALLRVPDSIPAETLSSLFTQLDQLADVIPGLLVFHAGTDITPRPLAHGFTHGFTINFTDAAARDVYWRHPVHLAVSEELVKLLDKGADDILIFQFLF